MFILDCIVEAKNTLGEGPVWDDVDQCLYWLDIAERQLFRLNPVNGEVIRLGTPAMIGSFAFRKGRSDMIVACQDGIGLFDPETGDLQLLATPERGVIGNRMNDGKCDPCGRFWCGSIHEVSDPTLRKPQAAVYRIGTDRQIDLIWPGIKTSNGFAWSPDGKTMYFTDTPTLRIMAYDYDLTTGTPSAGRVFAEVPQGQGRPDGATVDAEGFLWSAHFDGWCVTRYAPDGTVDQVIKLPAANVTSCAFGGRELDTLYITTAREDLTEEQLAGQPLAGGLFAMRPGVKGLPPVRFFG